MTPLAIDLFCGLGGWTNGLLDAGFEVIGFDIEQHAYGDERYPAQLVIQDVCTLHGRQFKDAALIVASSPCQEFSYRAMPWKRAKALGPPELGMHLFSQARRIQLEAMAAAGRFIPMVQENVRGAQPWVGRARWNYGSYYLWGDVPAIMPTTLKRSGVKVAGMNWSGSDKPGYKAIAFNDARHHEAIKNTGGSWFNIGSSGQKVTNNNPARQSHQERDGVENEGIKCGGDWFGPGVKSEMRKHSSKSSARKSASARIAKIPPALANHIAQTYFPCASPEP